MPEENGIIINVTGLGGAGKSTLLRDLPKAIERYSNDAVTCTLVDRSKVSRLHLVRVALGNPSLLVVAYQACSYFYGPRWLSLKRYRTWYGRLLIHRYCRYVSSKKEKPVIFLIDQGILQFLGMSATPFPKTLLSRIPLPDADLKLVVDRKTSVLRELYRDKPVGGKHLFTGDARLERGRFVAAVLLKTELPAEVGAILEKWGAKFCRPPLAADEIHHVVEDIQKDRGLRKEIGNKLAQREDAYARVAQVLEALGTATLRIPNDHGHDPRQTQALIARKILSLFVGSGLAETRK